MAKKQVPKSSLEDILYPLPQDASLNVPATYEVTSKLNKQFIRQALKASYKIKEPYSYTDFSGRRIIPTSLVTDDQVELVMSLMQSINPKDSVEAALAVQFTVTYIHGMKDIQSDYNGKKALEMFEFGHKALDMLQKYRNKGAQQISVQYNVNQGQVVNIKNVKSDHNYEKEE